MKLVTFEVATPLGRFERIGLLIQTPSSRVIDLAAAYARMLEEDDNESPTQARRWAEFLLPTCMRGFLEMGHPAMVAAKRVETWAEQAENLQKTSQAGGKLAFTLEEVSLKAPVPRPNALRDFLAFEVHTANGFKRRNEAIPEAWYKMPVYYKGNHRTIVGPNDEILWPHYTRKMDYELELACVIGKEGRNISVEDAPAYIAGYAILNDFSARDIQKDEMMCRLGPAKGKDFASALGPWLVTPDEVGDPRSLRMQARINGETWSDGNSGTSYWTFEQMIAHVSMDETLYPGDILGSGTVGFGCGLELDRWIQPGDTVELEIDKLGVLTNKLGQPQVATVPRSVGPAGK